MDFSLEVYFPLPFPPFRREFIALLSSPDREPVFLLSPLPPPSSLTSVDSILLFLFLLFRSNSLLGFRPLFFLSAVSKFRFLMGALFFSTSPETAERTFLCEKIFFFWVPLPGSPFPPGLVWKRDLPPFFFRNGSNTSRLHGT